MSRVGSTTRSGARVGSSSNALRMRTASTPICRIGCSTVVSGGVVERRLGDVVEADHREVARDREPAGSRRGHDRERHPVVGREDRRRPHVECQQPVRRLARRLRLEAAFPDEHRVEGDPRLLERVPVRRLPQSSRLEVGAPGDEADAPVAEPDQVLDGGDGAEEVLRIDRRERGRTDVVVDGDDRRAGRRIDAARCDEDDAVRERAADPRQVATLPAGLVGLLPAAGEDDELEPRAAGCPRRPP